MANYSPLLNFSLKSSKTSKNFKGTKFENINLDEADKKEIDGWFNQSSNGQIQGVGTNLYYKQNKDNLEKVIVAVIDSGVDVNHEDLDGKIWINKNEIPNNGIDDDSNGYVDDVMGWNFIGNADYSTKFEVNLNKLNGLTLKNINQGQVEFDSFEITRETKKLLDLEVEYKAKGIEFPSELLEKLNNYKEKVDSEYEGALESLNYFKEEQDSFLEVLQKVKSKFNLEEVSLRILEHLENSDSDVSKLVEFFEVYDDPELELKQSVHHLSGIAHYHYNINASTRNDIVKDQNIKNHYGNNNVIGPDPYHGTHVAGVIAATRNNGIGIKGISTNALIMPLRVVPNGDERDKDVANSIIYAVDNGAKIINMSFGKSYSPNTKLVLEAIKYAQEHDVLLIHAAGNENENIDLIDNFPTAFYSGYQASNWIEVGASNQYITNLFANFSNFGATKVDLFAPGVSLISTTPNNSYAKASGTSMATPVVSGIAAVIKGKYPKLSPQELKSILMNTGNRYPLTYAYNPNLKESVMFSTLSKSGSIPNLLKAMNFLDKNYVEQQPVNLSSFGF